VGDGSFVLVCEFERLGKGGGGEGWMPTVEGGVMAGVIGGEVMALNSSLFSRDGFSFSDDRKNGRCNVSEFAFRPRIGTIVHERCPMWRPGSQRLGLSENLGAFQVGQGPNRRENGDRPVFRGTSSLELGGSQRLRRPSADQ